MNAMADQGRVTRARKRAQEARDMRAKDSDRALRLLARAFPGLSRADGLKLIWDPYALTDWALDSARTDEQRDCVRFLLAVWDPGRLDHGTLGPFELHVALARWDPAHRAVFATWAADPWWWGA